MIESATPTRVERRMRQTASNLTAVCRRLTAERGLAGFTIEEVCTEVDVSRRSFFNYFASKEDAVFGVDADDEFQVLSEAFLAGRRGEWSDVLQDLVTFGIAHFEAEGVDAACHSDFMVALEREPRLMARFIGVSRDRERQVRTLIAEREGVGADDPHVVAVVSLLATLMQTSVERFLEPGNTLDFSTIVAASLAASRAVLAVPNH